VNGGAAVNDEESFDFLIPVVEVVPGPAPSGDAELERHVQLPGFLRRTTKVAISRAELEDFWKEKVVALTETLSKAQAEQKTTGFAVDEISFSLGVGASGGVAFVAQGSVEASMSVTLRRSN
jgi:hypothetical protein